MDNEKVRKVEEKFNFAEDILKEGDYVYYIDSNNESILCRSNEKNWNYWIKS